MQTNTRKKNVAARLDTAGLRSSSCLKEKDCHAEITDSWDHMGSLSNRPPDLVPIWKVFNDQDGLETQIGSSSNIPEWFHLLLHKLANTLRLWEAILAADILVLGHCANDPPHRASGQFSFNVVCLPCWRSVWEFRKRCQLFDSSDHAGLVHLLDCKFGHCNYDSFFRYDLVSLLSNGFHLLVSQKSEDKRPPF